MITANLMGGIGNLLFQISTTQALAWDNNSSCAFMHHIPKRQGNSTKTYVPNLLKRIRFGPSVGYTSIFKESHFHYAPIPYKEGMQLRGYFQSSKYFGHHREGLLSLYEPNTHIIQHIQTNYPFIGKEPTVALHIRRGDYLPYQHLHPICSEGYYRRALEFFKDHKVIIVSDDPVWCVKTFGKEYQIIVGERDWIDLYIMSMCSSNIIANSSFSWWSAWLNKNSKKLVIAPKSWFGDKKQTKDLYEDSWKIIKSK